MCVAQPRVLFLILSGGGAGSLRIHKKSLPPLLDRMGWLCVEEDVSNNAISTSKLADFLFPLFWFEWLIAQLVCITLLLLYF